MKTRKKYRVKILKTVEEYISLFPKNTRNILESIRQTIKAAAPDAEETISYKMPSYKQNGILVYFAAYENHIGFYPTSSGIEEFKKEISKYKYAKGSVQFPLNKPIPLKLIAKIVKFRIKENIKKSKKD
ncbi:MAG: DUF1801 domain-containing protein [bacterium]|nr:DUF1801 domain-containing protein [bacterium]